MIRPNLRPVSTADDDLLFEIYAGARAEELNLVPWDEAAKLGFLQMQFTAQQAHYQTHFPAASYDVILSGGIPVGRLYVDRREAEIRILDIALLPGARGRGIGSYLLQDLMKEAQAVHKALTIYIDTSSPHLRWFEWLGFVRAEDNGLACLMTWHPAHSDSVRYPTG
jgi:GNAT superfamily N-acetyltransferase